jgi:hypothetical protein
MQSFRGTEKLDCLKNPVKSFKIYESVKIRAPGL